MSPLPRPLIWSLPFLRTVLLPVVSVLIALEVNWLVAPHLKVLPPFLTFVAAVMATAWFGGFRAALFAIVLASLTVNYFFIEPLYSLALLSADVASIGFFAVEATIMAYCMDYLRRHEAQLREDKMTLEKRVANEQRLLEEQEEKVQGLISQLARTEERERQHLAGELHDFLAQLLAVCRIKLKQAQQFYGSSGKSNKFTEVDDLLVKANDYVRTLMAELYPLELKESGLSEALRSLAGQMPKHGLTVDIAIEEHFPVIGEEAVLLYQSVRELLLNVVKHAGVDSAVVSLRANVDELLIMVQDRGRGFDSSTARSSAQRHHFGLASVAERMVAMGGSCSIQSAIGRGTTVTLRLPLLPSSESTVVRAASIIRYDPVKGKPTSSPHQESLPL